MLATGCNFNGRITHQSVARLATCMRTCYLTNPFYCTLAAAQAAEGSYRQWYSSSTGPAIMILEHAAAVTHWTCLRQICLDEGACTSLVTESLSSSCSYHLLLLFHFTVFPSPFWLSLVCPACLHALLSCSPTSLCFLLSTCELSVQPNC